ncbi:MAG TPA: Uma2 family endonuclease [Phototrophicaceae bacterium]|nr:Uma2 family endonuclease [Phototrophicaceae bacterium]
MVVQERLITADEFWEIAQAPENERKRLELDEGVIVEMAGSSPTNTVIAARVIYFLNGYAIPRNAGYVTGPDGDYKLGERKVRQPDAAFVLKARIAKLPRHFNFAPDLAVEIVSPSEDALKKVNEYLRAGTQIVWAVYPVDKIVYVCTLNDDGSLRGQTFGIDDTLDGGGVLPGFTLPVRDIFPEG